MLWENCDKLDKKINYTNADYIIKQSNNFPWAKDKPNLIQYNLNNINYQTNLEIPYLIKKPQIYPNLPETRYFDFPYIVINTGWQNGAPTKKWLKKYWQELVDAYPDIQFVEIGRYINHPAKLNNVINLVGKTNDIQLVHLVRDAICVISPPSGVIHIAAAFDKPYISICGGR
jgi:ADP-heptose:LPS heptosyltransferase